MENYLMTGCTTNNKGNSFFEKLKIESVLVNLAKTLILEAKDYYVCHLTNDSENH